MYKLINQTMKNIFEAKFCNSRKFDSSKYSSYTVDYCTTLNMYHYVSMVTYSIQSVSSCATLPSQLHALFHTLDKIQCIVGVSLSHIEHIDFTITLPYSPSDTDVVHNHRAEG